MEKSNPWAELAVAAILTAGLSLTPAMASADEVLMEKCYGIVKKGMNDCGTDTHSCPALAAKDGDPDEWVYVPEGTCKKIVGGSLKKGGS